MNRLRYMKDRETGKRVSRPNPPDIHHGVRELLLIDQELWDAAKTHQTELTETIAGAAAGMPAHAPWDRRRPALSPLRAHALRAVRGGYSKISADLFGCSTARNKGTCSNRLNIRRDQIEAIVLEGLKTRLMDPELFKVFAEEFVAEVNRLRGNESAKAEQLNRELEATAKRIRRIVEAIAEGVPARSLKDELMTLEQRQEGLEREITRAPEPQPRLHPNLAELYRQKVAELHTALEQPTPALPFALQKRLIVLVGHSWPSWPVGCEWTRRGTQQLSCTRRVAGLATNRATQDTNVGKAISRRQT